MVRNNMYVCTIIILSTVISCIQVKADDALYNAEYIEYLRAVPQYVCTNIQIQNYEQIRLNKELLTNSQQSSLLREIELEHIIGREVADCVIWAMKFTCTNQTYEQYMDARESEHNNSEQIYLSSAILVKVEKTPNVIRRLVSVGLITFAKGMNNQKGNVLRIRVNKGYYAMMLDDDTICLANNEIFLLRCVKSFLYERESIVDQLIFAEIKGIMGNMYMKGFIHTANYYKYMAAEYSFDYPSEIISASTYSIKNGKIYKHQIFKYSSGSIALRKYGELYSGQKQKVNELPKRLRNALLNVGNNMRRKIAVKIDEKVVFVTYEWSEEIVRLFKELDDANREYAIERGNKVIGK